MSTSFDLYKKTIDESLLLEHPTVQQEDILASFRCVQTLRYLETLEHTTLNLCYLYYEIAMHYIEVINDEEKLQLYLEKIKNPMLKNNLQAEIYCDKEEYAKAIELLMKNGKDKSLYNIASIYYQQGDTVKALEYFLLDYENNKSFLSAYYIGCIYFYDESNLKNLSNAVEWFERSRELGNPDVISECFTWVRVLEAVKQNRLYEQEIKDLKRIRELDLGSLLYNMIIRYL